jgi:integrase
MRTVNIMATKSTRSRKYGKPAKPYPTFPLYAHGSGRWAKKVRGRTMFFGRWGTKDGNRIIPVDDIEESARQAKIEFDRQWPYISEGRTPPPVDDGCGCTITLLCNVFLTAKKNALDAGELSAHSFGEYHRCCQRLIDHFGGNRRVDDLRPDDFERFRAELAKGVNVVTLKSKINRLRVVFKYASDNRLIDRPVEYGSAFNRPSAKLLRKARNEAGPRMFSRDELLAMLGKAVDPPLRAMVLLGVNCGFGNTDVANLPQSAVDLSSRHQSWIVYPRPKTEIMRRIPLWPETAFALREAIRVRPKPAEAADAELCFLTMRGSRFVRVQASKRKADGHVTINAIARRFENLMNSAGVNARRGIGFYTLRHVFQTIGGEAKDPEAVSAIMGHVDSSMAGMYREGISDERLIAVTETVRRWLWPDASGPAAEAEGRRTTR